MSFDHKKLEKYPIDTGVYIMKDAQSKVLYVGKAKNLKVRLKQYFFPGRDTREMIPHLTSQITHIDTIVVPTEKEALILENTLIKKHKPKYNIMLKDDKSFVSLVLTNHKWPLLKIVRYKGKPKPIGQFFGPYTNAKAARQTLDLILKLFPLRQCSDSELSSRQRPCLLYDIKKCVAPCVRKCTEDEYKTLVSSAKKILLGKDKEVAKTLKRKMHEASDNLEFEKAGELHQMIQQLEHVLHVQHVDNPSAKDCDVIGLYRHFADVMIVCLFFRQGKLIGSEHFSFHQILENDNEVIIQFLLQHYLQVTPPSEILLPIPLEERGIVQELLTENAKKKVHLTSPQKGSKADLIELASKNAEVQFQREKDEKSLKEKMLLDLQENLYLERFPRRIECFDTSNIAGTDPVASMISFVNGCYDKSRTRLFKIKQANRSDDYGATKEVLERHFIKQKEKNDFCDLLIVDGGKGHLNVALQVFKELNIANVDIIGVAKQDAKHTKGMTEEKVFLPFEKDPIIINPRSPLLALLQKIRDEAHRVAIGFHRKKRTKRTLSSKLDAIEGIGPVKKKRLLLHFGSVKNIEQAPDKELREVKGITKKDIDNLRKNLS
ncbi:MAG: excinuclease ABC subunit UvrC [Chlamydiota bacterium]|jgi:excinuclease ABC subunit C